MFNAILNNSDDLWVIVRSLEINHAIVCALLQERESVCKKLDKFCRRRDVAIKEGKVSTHLKEHSPLLVSCCVSWFIGTAIYNALYDSIVSPCSWQDDNEIGELNCVIGMLEGQVQYTQEYISECQSQIMQIEEAKASLIPSHVFFSHWSILSYYKSKNSTLTLQHILIPLRHF